ncbi:hypothetical protein [Gordonia iterans]|nr:hypothetical protein [Gordonia iterans]
MDWDTPPAGVPWPVWLLLMLVGGPAGLSLLFTKTAAALPGALGAAGRWWQTRKTRKLLEMTDPPSARIDDAEIARLTRRYEGLAADAERDREQHRAQIAEVRAEVAELKASLTLANQRMWAAIGYIRVLVDAIRRIDPDHPIPDPPERLRDLI